MHAPFPSHIIRSTQYTIAGSRLSTWKNIHQLLFLWVRLDSLGPGVLHGSSQPPYSYSFSRYYTPWRIANQPSTNTSSIRPTQNTPSHPLRYATSLSPTLTSILLRIPPLILSFSNAIHKIVVTDEFTYASTTYWGYRPKLSLWTMCRIITL